MFNPANRSRQRLQPTRLALIPSWTATARVSVIPLAALLTGAWNSTLGKPVDDLFTQHCNYVDHNVEATGRHFNLRGHSKWHMAVVEKIYNREVQMWKKWRLLGT
jgi:hypothetical protein